MHKIERYLLVMLRIAHVLVVYQARTKTPWNGVIIRVKDNPEKLVMLQLFRSGYF